MVALVGYAVLWGTPRATDLLPTWSVPWHPAMNEFAFWSKEKDRPRAGILPLGRTLGASRLRRSRSFEASVRLAGVSLLRARRNGSWGRLKPASTPKILGMPATRRWRKGRGSPPAGVESSGPAQCNRGW